MSMCTFSLTQNLLAASHIILTKSNYCYSLLQYDVNKSAFAIIQV